MKSYHSLLLGRARPNAIPGFYVGNMSGVRYEVRLARCAVSLPLRPSLCGMTVPAYLPLIFSDLRGFIYRLNCGMPVGRC